MKDEVLAHLYDVIQAGRAREKISTTCLRMQPHGHACIQASSSSHSRLSLRFFLSVDPRSPPDPNVFYRVAGGYAMHEFSLVESILTSVFDVARQHGNPPVTRVKLEVGALQQVVPEALEFAFNAAVKGTSAEGAVLDWTEIPARIQCPACHATYEPADVFWVCPNCEAQGGKAIAGDDIVLASVELEDGESGQGVQ